MVKRYCALGSAILAISTIAACRRGGCTEETVRQSVINYLAKRANLNVAAMNVTVTSLACREKDADATVAFTAKDSSGGPPMTRRYALEREGDRWVVKESKDTGSSPHGTGVPQPGAALPPGHPAVGGGAPKQ
jgi:hypothetical protein